MKLLAFDTSTDVMSIAVTDGVRTWAHTGPGGAKASMALIPAILALVAEAGLRMDQLDAIAFGRGPGSFTGLRTACSVAQGLAFGARHGAGIPVLPVDTLMALAEEARFRHSDNARDGVLHMTALLDARMDEMYVQDFEFAGGVCKPLVECHLVRPENLAPTAGTALLAGNVFGVYADRFPAGIAAFTRLEALPTATAILRLAPALVAAGQLVDAALALPLYVRDKVALTTEERAVVKQQKEHAALAQTD
ncbi:MAG: tRNA (adenosine(37)-N6)-threonylcarbamoyltransferase complex dimerization subunit type 1 TsaB [Pseudomonadota bacterium]